MITYRPMQAADARAVSALCIRVFDEFIASTCKPEGRDAFVQDTTSAKLAERMQRNHMILAFDEERLVGAVDMKQRGYLKLLFIERAYQGQGLGRKLLSLCIEAATLSGHRPEVLEVKSAVNAVPFYEKLGFKRQGEEEEMQGIRFVTMKLDLTL